MPEPDRSWETPLWEASDPLWSIRCSHGNWPKRARVGVDACPVKALASKATEADLQFDPFWKWLRLPDYDAGIRDQNEAMAVSGVVVEFGNIRQWERLSGIGSASGVAAPYVGIRNSMASPRRSIPYASDASFRAVHSNKQEVDLIHAGSGLADEFHPTVAGRVVSTAKLTPRLR